MQHVQASSGGAREPKHALRRAPRGLRIAPDGMRRRLAPLGQMEAFAQARFVFRMHSHAPPPCHQRGQNVFVAIEQQRAGRGTEKRLHARHTRRLLQFAKRADVMRRGADVERIIAMHASLRARELVFEGEAGRGRRMGVRHFEDGRDPAQNRGAAAALRIFLVFIAGLAEMHLGIDHARQHVEASRLENGGRFRGQVSDGGDAATADAHIGFADSVWAGDRSAADEQVEHLSGRLS